MASTRQQIIEELQNLLTQDVTEIKEQVDQLKNRFYKEAGEVEEEAKEAEEALEQQFKELLTEYKTRKAEITAKATQELQANLERKNAMSFDRVWVVFDKDDFDDFNEAIKKAHKLGLHSAWTNEAFELWYYLYFEYLDTGISRAAYIEKLEEAFRNRMGDAGFKYQKGNPDNYKLLQQYGREDLAKRFAKQLRALHNGTDYAKHKPCTMVDKLVEELEHPEVLLVKKR